jgi:hypothetical protein
MQVRHEVARSAESVAVELQVKTRPDAVNHRAADGSWRESQGVRSGRPYWQRRTRRSDCSPRVLEDAVVARNAESAVAIEPRIPLRATRSKVTHERPRCEAPNEFLMTHSFTDTIMVGCAAGSKYDLT